VPSIQLLLVDTFWILVFLLGRYLRSFGAAHRQAEQLLQITESMRAQRERAAVLEERARIARDVHDILAHTLSALAVQLEAARAAMPRSRPAAEPRAHVERAQMLARQG